MAKAELLLSKLLTSSWIRRNNFLQVHSDITQLKNSVASFAVYLDNKNREMQRNHRSLIPVRSIQTPGNFVVRNINPCKEIVQWKKQYHEELNIKLINSELYDPIDTERYAPELCFRKRSVFFKNMQLIVPVEYAKQCTGNGKSCSFVWRIPDKP